MENVKRWVEKLKYPLLVICIGVVILLLPGKSDSPTVDTAPPETTPPSFTQELEKILADVEGAGECRVILTIERGEQTVYATNEQIGGNDTSRKDIVLITRADRSQDGLVIQTSAPIYRGAMVVCQGGDDPTVRLGIAEAISRLTGLGTDKISILKMK